MSQQVLVRYGVVPEVIRCRFAGDESLRREQAVVVHSPRGLQIGAVLESFRGAVDEERLFDVDRIATSDDLADRDRLEQQAGDEFETWQGRIAEWGLRLELLDLEYTLDGRKLIAYVLGDRGPDCTKLALQAAAAGLGTIEVQPVEAGGLAQVEKSGGGCGSGKCGCG
ncbi:MAG: hypothetical protein KF777_05735 [Planctomycetaceae bacterium]|jgi:cell fate regulator YaaT (PSP1 superfamily)|nr:hypothetical protein [Planctomycetaceae bacterium]